MNATEAPPANRRKYFNPSMYSPQTIMDMTDGSVDRVFIKWPKQGMIEVRYCERISTGINGYQCWLNLPRGVHAAMRNAGDSQPLYHHDFVDRH